MSGTSVKVGMPVNEQAHDDFQSLIHRIQSPALRDVAQHWHDARGNNRMPSWTDLSFPTLSPHFKMLWGFQYDPETGDITGRLSGYKIGKWVGPDFQGGRLQDLWPRSAQEATRPSKLYSHSMYEEAKQMLTKIITTPLAGRSSGRLFKVEDFIVTGERIGLPMAADGKTGDSMLGASDYVAPPLLGPIELIHENIEWYEI
jgi:hypothetical protein